MHRENRGALCNYGKYNLIINHNLCKVNGYKNGSEPRQKKQF